MIAIQNTTNRLPLMGQGAFVRAVATMWSGSRPCLIALMSEHEDQVQPGEGVVDA